MRNLKILAWIHIVTGVPTLLVALFFGAMIVSPDPDERIVGVIIGGLFGVKAATSLALAWGLLRYRPWSRLLGIIVSVLHLPLIPIGTAIGLFGLIVLEENKHFLAGGGPPSPFPVPEYPAGEYPVDGRTGVNWQ